MRIFTLTHGNASTEQTFNTKDTGTVQKTVPRFL